MSRWRYDEGLVMVLEQRHAAAGGRVGSHRAVQRPLVNRMMRRVPLE